MPIPSLRHLARLVVPALFIAALGAPAAASATVPVDLHVVADTGRTLAEFRQYTGTVTIGTDPGADCFGAPGGSGDRVTIPGPTALGVVRDALDSDSDLRPLSITDQFSFGLAVCGIGGYEAGGSSSWYLKDNHAGAQVGGDQLRVGRGDEVLWYLSPSYPYPPELVLHAPARARTGVPFQVTVEKFDDAGTESPVSGAVVAHALAPTDSNGHATVTIGSAGTVALRARHGSAIPSNAAEVCVAAEVTACPAHRGKTIVGSGHGDDISGTRGADDISGRGGADVIGAKGGGADSVSCGAGDDRVTLDSRDHADSGCERLVRG